MGKMMQQQGSELYGAINLMNYKVDCMNASLAKANVSETRSHVWEHVWIIVDPHRRWSATHRPRCTSACATQAIAVAIALWGAPLWAASELLFDTLHSAKQRWTRGVVGCRRKHENMTGA